jgi:adenosylcobinamide kinase/adenosylcobinamide-phosphate guanylyltransferase
LKTLILGGARSGKSALAAQLAAASGLDVVYIATAEAGDGEMAERIAHHRDTRPAHWRLVEEPIELAATLAREAAPERCLLVDCLTLWLSNLLAADDESLLAQEQTALVTDLDALPGAIILVSNEVGLGIVPANPLARRFRDLAGRLHQDLATRCDQVVFSAAGLPWVLKGPRLLTPQPTPTPRNHDVD